MVGKNNLEIFVALLSESQLLFPKIFKSTFGWWDSLSIFCDALWWSWKSSSISSKIQRQKQELLKVNALACFWVY